MKMLSLLWKLKLQYNNCSIIEKKQCLSLFYIASFIQQFCCIILYNLQATMLENIKFGKFVYVINTHRLRQRRVQRKSSVADDSDPLLLRRRNDTVPKRRRNLWARCRASRRAASPRITPRRRGRGIPMRSEQCQKYLFLLCMLM